MRNVQTLFGDIAAGYDFFCHLSSFYLDFVWRRKINSFIHSHETVLDLGSGTGAVALRLGKASRVIGIDFSPEMLKRGLEKKALKKNAQRVKFLLAKAEEIPFLDDSFHSVVSSFVFRHLQDNIGVVLKEIYRIIKPGGKILILEFGRPDFAFFRKIYYLYLGWVVPLLGGIIFGQSKVRHFQYLKETILRFFSPKELKRIMTQAGLKKVKYYPLTGGIVGFYYGLK